ncbi:MAG: nucleoside hydrolase [Clostridium sp.]|uniref:nucleoside hydrolase n=1 Tax=Clostridium sp. TaxID=1506 RepID=UPI002911FB20|nr:nucleoside hydrolase [Clostridium sp.]MDU5109778.1 nucleoside hydrolase [Clostridium sp.]
MKMILDLDTGIDDALAIAYTIGKKEVDLIGITTVFGNINVHDASRNSLNILKLLDSENIPVYKGAEHSVTSSRYEQKRGGKIFHGGNGIADITLDSSIHEYKEGAVDFILDSVEKYGKDLTIVATGPLTNIAEAIKKSPETMRKVNKIVIMGGALTVPGNVSPFAEANFSQDAKSVGVVLSSENPITLIGLDVTLKTLLTRDDVKSWESISDKSKCYHKIIDYYFKAHEMISPDMGGCALHDPLAVGVAINPNIVSTTPFSLGVIVDGDQNGRVISNNKNIKSNSDKNVEVALDVKAEEFKEDFLNALYNVFK